MSIYYIHTYIYIHTRCGASSERRKRTNEDLFPTGKVRDLLDGGGGGLEVYATF